jgi:hypothetical protein
MITLLAAAILTQKMPNTALRLKAGDAWTTEYTYHYMGDDIDLANTETSKFTVVREGKREVLTVEWRLKETKVDGHTVPAAKGIEPVRAKVTLTGEGLTNIVGDDVTRHRIERAIQIERKGNLQEPAFFPVPPHVRLVGISKIVELDSRIKDRSVLAVAIEERGGDRPIRGIGHYVLHPESGILLEAGWNLTNSPIPGGDKICDLTVTAETKGLKLAPRVKS